MARKLKLSQNGIAKALRLLIQAGIVKVSEAGEYSIDPAGLNPNGFTNEPKRVHPILISKERNKDGESEASSVKASVAVQDVTNGSESPAQPASPAAPNPAEDAFNAFWAAYPRKTAKKAARSAFARLVRGRQPEAIKTLLASILSALEAFKKTEQWQKSQFIPHPATFINQERWEDEDIAVNALPPKDDGAAIMAAQRERARELGWA